MPCTCDHSPIQHAGIQIVHWASVPSAGIPGFKTNHSLRATATSRLYHCGVDEQLIMECTESGGSEILQKDFENSEREPFEYTLNQEKPQNHSTTPHESSSCTQIATQKHKQLVTGPSLPSSVFRHCTVNFYMAPGTNSLSTSSTRRANKRAFIESDSESD